MNNSVTIIEVLGRSEQGITRPFLCRGDDGRLYYVKGNGAGQRSLCCEWVAGRLAQEVGLCLPDFEKVHVPKALVEASGRNDIRELGAGPAFGSAVVDVTQELTWPMVERLSVETKALVFLFDWWVQNEDRTLSLHGGNPNMLVTVEMEGAAFDEDAIHAPSVCRTEKLWVFDFNLAFDTDFDSRRFLGAHAFAWEVGGWPPGFRTRMEARMSKALAILPAIFRELPDEWLYLQGDDSLDVILDETVVKSVLNRAFSEPDLFWIFS